MANLGKWIVDVVAVFDPKKIEKQMNKAGLSSAKKFVKKFNEFTGSKLPTSLSGAISQGITVALNQADSKLKQYKDLADKIMGKEQNIDQVSLETGVNGSILESLGRLQEIKGGDTSDILGVFQNINKDLMSGQSQLGGKNTLDAFNKILDRVFAEKDQRRRGMIAEQLGVGELKGMLLGSSKAEIQEQLIGLGSDGGGVINDRSDKQKRARNNIERVRKESQMEDIQERDLVEDAANSNRGTFEQVMLREQKLSNDMLKNSIDHLAESLNFQKEADEFKKQFDEVKNMVVKAGSAIIDGIKEFIEWAKSPVSNTINYVIDKIKK